MTCKHLHELNMRTEIFSQILYLLQTLWFKAINFSFIQEASVNRVTSLCKQFTHPEVYTLYGIMTEERVIHEIRIDEAAGQGDSDSRMTRFEVIMPLKLQSAKLLIYSI